MNFVPSIRIRLVLIVLITLLTTMLLLLQIGNSDIDLVLADFMFDPATRTFPWRHVWIVEKFGHDMLKIALIVMGSIPILLCIWDRVRPIAKWSTWFRIRMQVVALSSVLVPLVVSTLKSFNASHCPWDVDRYGGAAPYIRLLEALPDGLTPGHCFPAGHATGALWLVSIALFWWPHRPRTAILVGFAMLTLGFGVGWAQQMRGAHFLTHTLWSMWIACTIIVTLFFILNRSSRLRREELSGISVRR